MKLAGAALLVVLLSSSSSPLLVRSDSDCPCFDDTLVATSYDYHGASNPPDCDGSAPPYYEAIGVFGRLWVNFDGTNHKCYNSIFAVSGLPGEDPLIPPTGYPISSVQYDNCRTLLENWCGGNLLTLAVAEVTECNLIVISASDYFGPGRDQ